MRKKATLYIKVKLFQSAQISNNRHVRFYNKKIFQFYLILTFIYLSLNIYLYNLDHYELETWF